MAHAVETMAWVGDIPWHGLGIEVEPTLTPQEMLVAAGLDWTVSARPIKTTTDIPITSHRMLMRDSDDAQFGICGSNYVPFQNDKVFEFFKRFTDAGDLKITNIVYFTEETDNSIGDGATGAIDWNVSQKQNVTITGTGITCNFTNPPSGACNLVLKVVQGDGGDEIETWDSDILWPGGTAPTLSTGSGDIDIISFYWDGSKYYGMAALDFD